MNQSRIMNAQTLAKDLNVPLAQMAAIMNAMTPGNPAGMNGQMGFTVDIYEQITAKAYDVLLPEILWSKTIPQASIDTSINPGAKLVSYRVRDRRGKGAFRAAIGKDIPTVGLSMNKVVIPLESAGVMASADIDDIRAVSFGFEGMNLLTDLGVVMREASERHIEEVFFFGYEDLGFAGYVDYSLVPTTTASVKAGGGTTWAVATGDEIARDIFTALGTVYENSKGIFIPGKIELPLKQFMQIAGQRMGGSSGATGENVTVLDYIRRNNPYRTITGQELEVVGLRYLDGAGTGGADRMRVSDPSPDHHYMPMSNPFEMLPPQDRQFATDLFAHWKFGSYHMPYPTSALFVDGI